MFIKSSNPFLQTHNPLSLMRFDVNSPVTGASAQQPSAAVTSPEIKVDITNPFAQPERSPSGQPQTPAQQQAAVTLDDIINKKSFGSFSQELFEQASTGDVNGFNEAMTNMTRNMYKDIMLDAASVIDAKVKAALSGFETKQGNISQANQIVADMVKEFPTAGSAEVLPTAKLILQGFLRQGMTPDKAQVATINHLKTLGGKVVEASKPQQSGNTKSGADALAFLGLI